MSGAGPRELGEYRLIELLGRGGMGEVYLAHDRVLDRHVAVKLIASRALDATTRGRFFVEARALARVQHPNVLAIHRVGEWEGRPYLVSELVRGGSLRELARPVEEQRALELALGVARGLAAVHRAGVIHRDIKLSNVALAEDGTVKLLDFGVAKLLEVAEGIPVPQARSAPEPDDAGGDRTLTAADRRGAQVPGPTAPRVSPVLGAVPLLDRAPPLGAVPPLAAQGAGLGVARAPGGLTLEGLVVGTPRYLAPEAWLGAEASRAADVYALGVLLYELVSGRTPIPVDTSEELARRACAGDIVPLAEAAPTLDPRFAAVIARCLARDPAARFASGDAVREALEAIAAPLVALEPEREEAPYRGLRTFEAEHHALFFGRAREVRALAERLRADRLVLVTGDSGTGKSSLCRAGLLPALAASAGAASPGSAGAGSADAGSAGAGFASAGVAGAGFAGAGAASAGLGGALRGGAGLAAGAPEVPAWATASLVPGRAPLVALARALVTFAPGLDEDLLAARLARDPVEVARELRARCPGERALLVDQLEELFTLAPAQDRAPFAVALHALAFDAEAVRLVGTVRADYLGRVAELERLGEHVSGAIHLLRPLGPEALRDAITGPARARGYAIEPESLVESLVGASSGAADLPLLQFALEELWARRDRARRTLGPEALAALGGVAGCLDRHADGVLASLLPKQRPLAREVLLALVTVDRTRSRRTEAELEARAPGAREVLPLLVRGRLLVAREEGARTAYELTHEALVTSWRTLASWLDGEGEQRALVERVERLTAEWTRLGRPDDGLLGERQLQELAPLVRARLAPPAADLLGRSERALASKRRRGLLLRVGAPALLALALAPLAKVRYDRAREVSFYADEARRARASARTAVGDAERLRAEALAAFDAGRDDDAERVWASALEARRGAEAALARADESWGRALGLAPADDEVRGGAVETALERVRVVDALHGPGDRAGWVRRLEALDPTGAAMARLRAPATLALATTPPGARVTLLRYGELDGRSVVTATTALGETPLEVEVEPGSVALVFTGAGRPDVRDALLLHPGERRARTLSLPAAADVPEGFVWIPPGRFLVGSADDEPARRFLNAQPLHEVETGAYLIGRHEVTFGEWIDWLRSLSPAERRAHWPKGQQLLNGVALEEVDGRLRLTLEPAAQRYVALEGEPIRYASRARRSVQRWERFPVTNVSYEEAELYTRWLDATGRVPGARLCTELEWERAARGADGRSHPGGERPRADDQNVDETYGRVPGGFGPDEVGAHPGSRSPFGVDDLAGNVWEWTRSASADARPVQRGGCWYMDLKTASAPNREPSARSHRDPLLGLRVCASRP